MPVMAEGAPWSLDVMGVIALYNLPTKFYLRATTSKYI